MARQRFIWPEIWKDPVFGRLQHIEQVMFVGLFSIADDEGRLNADPAYLKSELFTYKDYTNKKVKGIRDGLVARVPSVHLYSANGCDLIALLKWGDYQKPKYPKPSKLPPPYLGEGFPQASPNPSPELETSDSSGDLRVGLGREGLGRAVSSGDDIGENERPSDSTIFQIPKLKEAS